MFFFLFFLFSFSSISFQLGAHRSILGNIPATATTATNASAMTDDIVASVLSSRGESHNTRAISRTRTFTESFTQFLQKTNRRKKHHQHQLQQGWCCCSHNVYTRFSRCCFLVKDVEHFRDVRCFCSMNQNECQPNALLKIPRKINNCHTDDPSANTGCGCLCTSRLSELYYQAVKMSLCRLISFVIGIYFLYIFSFGFTIWAANYVQDKTLNYAGETNKTILNLTEFESFRNSFALAHQTISTIGYGHIAPASDAIHVTIFLYGAFGLIVCSLLVAVIWSRFTAVRPVLAFSTKAVMSKWNGQLALRFKIAGLWRPKPILTGEVTVNAVLSVKGEDGLKISRLVQLPVEIKYNPLMVLPWTVVHIVNENSPLYGVSERNFSSTVKLITTVFSGMDSCTGHEISAMYAYPSKNVIWDHRFATSIVVDPDSGGKYFKRRERASRMEHCS